MMLAEVGLPPGADVDRASLGKLLDNGAIARYELQPDRIVFICGRRGGGRKFRLPLHAFDMPSATRQSSGSVDRLLHPI